MRTFPVEHVYLVDVLKGDAAATQRALRPATALGVQEPEVICNEARRMWSDLADVLTMNPENYACCCGPDSVPGHEILKGSSA